MKKYKNIKNCVNELECQTYVSDERSSISVWKIDSHGKFRSTEQITRLILVKFKI